MIQIKNQKLRLTLSRRTGTYIVESLSDQKVGFASAMDILFKVGGTLAQLKPPPWENHKTVEDIPLDTPVGKIDVVQLHLSTTARDVVAVARIGLSSKYPLAFIQLELINNGTVSIRVEKLTVLDIPSGGLQLNQDNSSDPVFFSNGWQSWSYSGCYGMGEKQRISHFGPIQNPMAVNPGTPIPKKMNYFAGDMFGVLGDRRSRFGLLAGFLSQKKHFGSLETRFHPQCSLKVWANGDQTVLLPGRSMKTDWAVIGFIDLDSEAPLQPYFNAVAETHKISLTKPIPVGWCSWYEFYEDITEENITANLKSVVERQPELPLDLFQIDDGFEAHPGDWFDFDPAFPNQIAPLADSIKSGGLTPGLWLAPFIVHPKADLVRKHPDWLLRDDKGKLVNAGFVWNKFTYALDLTHPDALDYACQVVTKAVKDWGYEYLKLDFLYAAALKGTYQDPTLTRAQVLRKGLEVLRNAVGEHIMLLACGCPLGSALGLFDAMRISADVSGSWDPHYPPFSIFLKNEPHMPSARNAIHNILTRAMFHRRWWINDPDCLLVRSETDLTLAEVQTLTTVIGMTGGSLMLSDDLPNLTQERRRLAQSLLPLIGKRARILDVFDSPTPARLRVDMGGGVGKWHLLAVFNWEDQPTSVTFSTGEFDLPNSDMWWFREFWTGQIGKMGDQDPITFHDVPPHGVRLVAARLFQADQPAYLGSDLHLSQGMEISQWHSEKNELSLQFKLDRETSGKVFFYLPWQPTGAWFKGHSHLMEDLGGKIYAFYLEDLDGESLTIKK